MNLMIVWMLLDDVFCGVMKVKVSYLKEVVQQSMDERLGQTVTRVVLPRVIMHYRYHYRVLHLICDAYFCPRTALVDCLELRICTSEDDCRYGRIGELFVYEKFNRVPMDSVEAGDICAVCGIGDIQIGETIADKALGKPLPAIQVEEPTVKVSFSINTSPFVGREGKNVTSRNLRGRLYRELERNLAMKFEDGENSDTFIVSGRGTLHITILIENMLKYSP